MQHISWNCKSSKTHTMRCGCDINRIYDHCDRKISFVETSKDCFRLTRAYRRVNLLLFHRTRVVTNAFSHAGRPFLFRLRIFFLHRKDRIPSSPVPTHAEPPTGEGSLHLCCAHNKLRSTVPAIVLEIPSSPPR